MKKKIIIVISVFLIVLIVMMLFPIKTESMRADELFGRAASYTVSFGSLKIGYINGWGGWAIVEKFTAQDESECMLFPLSHTLSDARPVYCQKWYHANSYSGFIYFRGHERPFCGANTEENMPNNCLKIGEVTHG